jgi:hypothetical protein
MDHGQTQVQNARAVQKGYYRQSRIGSINTNRCLITLGHYTLDGSEPKDVLYRYRYEELKACHAQSDFLQEGLYPISTYCNLNILVANLF